MEIALVRQKVGLGHPMEGDAVGADRDHRVGVEFDQVGFSNGKGVCVRRPMCHGR